MPDITTSRECTFCDATGYLGSPDSRGDDRCRACEGTGRVRDIFKRAIVREVRRANGLPLWNLFIFDPADRAYLPRKAAPTNDRYALQRLADSLNA